MKLIGQIRGFCPEGSTMTNNPHGLSLGDYQVTVFPGRGGG